MLDSEVRGRVHEGGQSRGDRIGLRMLGSEVSGRVHVGGQFRGAEGG